MTKDTSSVGGGRQRDGSREQFWRATLDACSRSGQSVRAFCRARQLSEPSFYAWRRTLAGRDGQPPQVNGGGAPTPPAPAFLPIRLAESSSSPIDGAPIEIVLAGGCCIRLRPPVDRAALSDILAALRSEPAGEVS